MKKPGEVGRERTDTEIRIHGQFLEVLCTLAVVGLGAGGRTSGGGRDASAGYGVRLAFGFDGWAKKSGASEGGVSACGSGAAGALDSGEGCGILLNDVGEFVGEQALTVAGAGLILIGREDDVVADGVGERADG